MSLTGQVKKQIGLRYVRNWIGRNGVATGTNTYVLTLTPPLEQYYTGQIIEVTFTNSNTGASTININGLGAKSITKNGSSSLASGDISAGQTLLIGYDGTRFQLLGGSGGGGGGGGLSGTAGQVAVFDSSTTATSYASLLFDNSNVVLQLGAGTPTVTANRFSIVNTGNTGVVLSITNTTTASTQAINIYEDSSKFISLGRFNSTAASNYTGTSIANADTFFIKSGTTSNLPIVVNGTPIINLIGTTATNIGTRLSAAGLRIDQIQNLQTDATALLHLAAGSTAAGSAPLKLTSGTLNTTAEAGAVEFLTDKIYFTITTGASRKEITLNDVALTSGRIPFTTTNGRITDSSNLLFNSGTGVITLSGAISATTNTLHAFVGSTNQSTTTVTAHTAMFAVNNTNTTTGTFSQFHLYNNSINRVILYSKLPSTGTSGQFGINVLSNNSLATTHLFIQGQAASAVALMNFNGQFFVGDASTTPTALLHLAAGTASAGTAPLKITSGTKLTTAEAGAVEYNGRFYFTKSSDVRYSVGGTINVNTTAVANTGAGTDEDLITYTLPANALSVNGDYVEVIGFGDITNSANSKTVKMFFGATGIAAGTSPGSASSGWEIVARIIRTGATSQLADGTIGTLGNTQGNTQYTTPVETLSGTVVIKCTGSSSGANEITQRSLIVRIYTNNS